MEVTEFKQGNAKSKCYEQNTTKTKQGEQRKDCLKKRKAEKR